MNPSESSKEILSLFDAACDGTLSDASVAKLEELLENSDLREQYLDYFELHAELYFRSCANRAERRAVVVAMTNDSQVDGLIPGSGRGQALPLPQSPVPGLLDSPSALSSSRFPGAPSFTLSTVLHAIARTLQSYQRTALATFVLLIALSTWLLFSPQTEIMAEKDRQPIATLVASDDAQWQEGLSPDKKRPLLEGQALQLLSGRAQISMSSGAELVFKSPCTIELKGANLVDLRDGVLSIRLADWTKDFAITTENVQVVDLGKQFVVSADAATSAVEAHAIDGKLRVLTADNSSDSTGLLVMSGDAVRIDPTTNTSARLRANQGLFDAGISDAPPFKPLKLANTGIGLTPGSEDPNWVIIDSSAEDFTEPRLAVVCNPFRNRHLKNDPEKSQWISVGGPDHQLCPSNTMYTFETEVNLTEYDLSSLTVVAQVLADNGVMGVRINGERVDFKPKFKVVSAVFNKFQAIEIKQGFIEGINKIQFDVWNDNSGSSQSPTNPMAFRVEWQAFGRMRQSQQIAASAKAIRTATRSANHFSSDFVSNNLLRRSLKYGRTNIGSIFE